MDIKTFLYKSPIGNIYCTFDDENFLLRMSLDPPSNVSEESHPFFKELDGYFKGYLKVFKQKIRFLDERDFQRYVWLSIRNIPYGEVRTYKWLSERIGKPSAFRAVGQALKKNPLPIIIPCHRIICSKGALGGFSWGTDIKKFLLIHEKRNL